MHTVPQPVFSGDAGAAASSAPAAAKSEDDDEDYFNQIMGLLNNRR